MRFYIFADDSNDLISTPKGAKFSSTDYNETLETFTTMNKEYAFCNSYIIVDFECKHSKMAWYESYDNIKDYVIVPFMIINEFHYNRANMNCNAIGPDGKFDPYRTIRKDSIIIETSGFVQEFNNNYGAIKQFLYYLDNSIPATMSLLFSDEDKKNSEYKRKIASSIEVLRDKKVSIKKIKLSNKTTVIPYKFPKRKIYSFNFEADSAEFAVTKGV